MSTKNTGHSHGVRYPRFAKINGQHPLRAAVPDICNEYRVRTRHGGNICYFNFSLAREMGLLPQDHEPILNKTLTETLLGTFSLVIINEYDIENNTRIPEEDIRPGKYMATRYLQLQHPDKSGRTSGDGRSIWNGCIRGRNAWWDISSCGTGATSLSPATAIAGRHFKTGDKLVSYGCGRADLKEGLGAALNSEIFHRNGIPTERTLAVIGFRDGSSINVRASKNLIRPAHLFRYLKQGDHEGLRQIANYYCQRQIDNGCWPPDLPVAQYPQFLLQQVAADFSRVAALYESEYIFCWIDWDGDNILMDGGIIDYGSIRQFGLYHYQYRYNDVDRMSTTIPGQKHKARYIVQTFAQIADFLATGKKRNIHHFRNHESLTEFNREYLRNRQRYLLYRVGYTWEQIDKVQQHPALTSVLKVFHGAFSYFEQCQSSTGTYEVTDGITSDAVFCMRDILRELPLRYLQQDKLITYRDFIDILKSDYAQECDLALHSYRRRRIHQFQHAYRELLTLMAQVSGCSERSVLLRLSVRSTLINRYERVTGDAIIGVTDKLLQIYRRTNTQELLRVFENFVEQQILKPEYFSKRDRHLPALRNAKTKKVLHAMLKTVKDSREGI